MSIQQKMMLLANWLPVGLPHFTHGSKTYLHLKDVPYEFESIIARWLVLNPNLTEHDSKGCVLMDHPEGLAINQDGWEEFVYWVIETLKDRLNAMEGITADTPDDDEDTERDWQAPRFKY